MPAMERKEAGAHPVRCRGHAVGDGMDAAAGNVEFPGGAGLGPDGDADVEREAQADEQIGEGFYGHYATKVKPWVDVGLVVVLGPSA